METLSGLRLPLSLLPAEAVPVALGCVEEIRAALWLRVNTHSSPRPEAHEDRLLNAKEAAQRLGYSVGTVYKRADEFPFTVRQSARGASSSPPKG